MATNTSIEWTQMTWNPVTGCTKISAGCKHCYAERMAKRLKAMGVRRYLNEFQVTVHDDLIMLPKKWLKPRMIFVNSMSDLFHEDIPLDFIKKIFITMKECPQHTYQILTKRSKRLSELAMLLEWPANIWMGVTVENQNNVDRIKDLISVPAQVRFLSCEPLLGPIDNLPLAGINWVIVGGESGPGARPMDEEWVDGIYNQCLIAEVPFFFKQWGGVRKKRAGRLYNNRIFSEMPMIAS